MYHIEEEVFCIHSVIHSVATILSLSVATILSLSVATILSTITTPHSRGANTTRFLLFYRSLVDLD